jgi:hypothetical protein
VDTMSRREIGDLLSRRLPQCAITCSIHADHSLSVEVIGPDQRQFTVANMDRSSAALPILANARCLALLPRLLSCSSQQPSRSSLCAPHG